MATIKLRKGQNPIAFLGSSSVAFNSLNWITAANVSSIFAVTANGLGYTKFTPGSTFGPQSFVPVTDGTIAGYVIVTKQAFTVDAALFAAGSTLLTQLPIATGYQASPLLTTPTTALNVIANSVSGASGYQLYSSATQSGTYTKLGAALSNPAYSHTGLTAGQTQWYKWVILGNGTSFSDSDLSPAFSGTTQAAPNGAVRAWRYKKMGQSQSVSAAPIDPSNDPKSVAYNPLETLSGGALSRVTPSLLRTFQWVYIWNNTAQAWQPYNVRQNAQGFTGLEGDGSVTYMPGFCSFLGLAQWWEENRPGEYLLLEKAGAVGQPISYFQRAAGDGMNNAYHAVANRTWLAADAALPALQAQFGITDIRVLGYEWNQGDTENDVPNYVTNLTTLRTDLANDGYWPHTADSIDLIVPTLEREDVNAQKAIYIAQNPGTVTHPHDRMTTLVDRVHWDAPTNYRMGYQEIPEALAIKVPSTRYHFRGFADTTGNTASKWLDESSAYNDLVASSGAEPVLVSDKTTGKKAYGVALNGHSKLLPAIYGGWQKQAIASKTLIFGVQQPLTTSPQYVFDNGSLGISPGETEGAAGGNGQYIGGNQDASNQTILVFELDATGPSDNGNLYVYNGTTLQGSGPCNIARLGNPSFFSTQNSQYSQYDAQVGTYLMGCIVYTGISAAQRAASVSELAAKMSVGTKFTVATQPVGNSTITATEPTGSVSDLGFNPREVGIARKAGNVWYCQGQLNGAHATMLATSYLAAGTSGRVMFQYKTTAAANAAIGFHTSPVRVRLDTMSYGIYLADASQLAIIEAGVPSSVNIAATVGYYYAVTRIAEVRDAQRVLIDSGLVRVEESADGITWTTIYTYSSRATGSLYVPAHFFAAIEELQNPRGQSLSTLAVSTTSGHFETERQLTGQYGGDDLGGGLATADLSEVTYPAFTAWFQLNLTTAGQVAGYADYQLPLCLGYNGTTEELGAITCYPDGKADFRVRLQNGGYVFSDKLSLTAGTDKLFIITGSASGIQFFIGDDSSSKATGSALNSSASHQLLLGGNLQTGTPNGPVLQYPAGGTYSLLGFANREFSASELAQLQAANGRLATLPDTVRYFVLDNITTTTQSVADAADSTKLLLLNSGKQ